MLPQMLYNLLSAARPGLCCTTPEPLIPVKPINDYRGQVSKETVVLHWWESIT